MSSLEETSSGRLPDFIVIGAMKGGSTTLWGLLAAHPQIFMCDPKEPQFFSRPERFERGLAGYRALFADASPEQRVGEASTCYSRWPHHGPVAQRVAGCLPNVKLIYQLRHPVERAYSHYQHLMEERVSRSSGPVISFARAIEEIPEILDASRYWLQIEQYLAHFPRGQLLVLTLDELRVRPRETWREIQAFLSVAPTEIAPGELPVDNAAGTQVARGGMRQWVRRVRRLPGWARIKALMPASARNDVRAWLLRPDVARRIQRARMHAHQQAISPLEPETRRNILEQLDEQTRALEHFLGRELPEWRA